jgi:hypothetical protein
MKYEWETEEQFASLAEAIEAEQNNTYTEIEVLKTEVERNRHVLKSIANLIEESI